MSLWKAEQEIEIPKSFNNWKTMTHEELKLAFDASPKTFQDVIWKFLSRTEGNIQMFLSYRDKLKERDDAQN